MSPCSGHHINIDYLIFEVKPTKMHDPTSSDTDSATMKETQVNMEEKSKAISSPRDSIIEPVQELASEGHAEQEVLTGFPLQMLITGICLAGFIFSLDIGIITTVSKMLCYFLSG